MELIRIIGLSTSTSSTFQLLCTSSSPLPGASSTTLFYKADVVIHSNLNSRVELCSMSCMFHSTFVNNVKNQLKYIICVFGKNLCPTIKLLKKQNSICLKFVPYIPDFEDLHRYCTLCSCFMTMVSSLPTSNDYSISLYYLIPKPRPTLLEEV